MGWLFGWQSKAELIRHLTADEEYTQNEDGASPRHFRRRTMRSAIRGKCLWCVNETRCLEDGKIDVWIGLALIERDGQRWGYKDMSEESGPNYYTCPLSFLDEVPPPPSEFAVSWRMEVRAYHEAAKHQWCVGDRFVFAGHEYELLAPAKRSWSVRRLSDGRIFRASPRHLIASRMQGLEAA